ncbi:recombinase RecT [Rhodococcus rhodochrous]|uniref:recombinase RecT n=1 Tax=Rhodococcus rhodochrous TaxID=1829 RepID=UPI001E4932CB|nr:recombinase RecT [Rhodococcus rhodochrous]MCD2096558.1 recombinase RecT [Rhodococcus rhodochrous]MCD2121224.1 recombinase RecT [Rhodococcus rhodochrous]MCQ4137317.1 recombinase RecT [Rhodococcus rhodochrous]MDJ0021190.1 recombinase RecT [Rhodococcus rhodochrous]
MTNLKTAVATRDNTPRGMIAQYSQDFATVLPSHVKPETFVRIAQGALKKGKKDQQGRTELEIAASNNPPVFMAALLDAARLGLEPGTEQYYLTPRKVKGKLEILGIVGYQGIIELMYRAGAISSVVAEVVYSNDIFRYQPGRDEIPNHEIDWDADDRGTLRLVYAYARMKDGSFSKVVVLNKADIARIKKSSQGSSGEYSPWTQHEPSMWLKSAVRQLQKWVPTSAEYVREQLRAVRDVQTEGAVAEQIRNERTNDARAASEDRSIGDIIDGDIVDDNLADGEVLATDEQVTALAKAIADDGITDPAEAVKWAAATVKQPDLEKLEDLTHDQAQWLLDGFNNEPSA